MKLDIQVSGKGRNLVLIHGWAMSSLVWAHWLDELEKSYQVIRVELPGHGISQHNQSWSMNELLEMLAQQLPAKCSVLGHSLGGMVALAYAAKYPLKVESLVMLASSAKFVQTSDWQHAQALETFTVFGEGLLENPKLAVKQFLLLQTQGMRGARKTTALLKGLVNDAPAKALIALNSGLDALKKMDLRAELKSISCPLLMLLGEQDQLVPVGVGTDSLALNTKIKLVVISGAAHVPFLSHQADVMRAIEQFIPAKERV
ncbi:MAG: hypothetical protein A6F72_01330 [Cycloclasticus sp. symbiont of Poecilosclerida sp. N]|nr:MAG: hypothetical protein A6F72_01330 [Cycloclasticus sp. symbiont of Poecilosclerida sp. N]